MPNLEVAPFLVKGSAMKVFLDDERPTPPGWIAARWPDEAITLLQTGQVTELSLDHDLGNDEIGTGYSVLLWIEKAVALNSFVPPAINIHTANASARQKMMLALRSIERLTARGLNTDDRPTTPAATQSTT